MRPSSRAPLRVPGLVWKPPPAIHVSRHSVPPSDTASTPFYVVPRFHSVCLFRCGPECCLFSWQKINLPSAEVLPAPQTLLGSGSLCIACLHGESSRGRYSTPLPDFPARHYRHVTGILHGELAGSSWLCILGS